jgi:hypothetical protein
LSEVTGPDDPNFHLANHDDHTADTTAAADDTEKPDQETDERENHNQETEDPTDSPDLDHDLRGTEQ